MKIKVNLKKHPIEEVIINSDFIRLDSFLKFKGIAQTGGHAKLLIQDGEIKVNNEICTSRGKKIKSGDTVTADKIDYVIK